MGVVQEAQSHGTPGPRRPSRPGRSDLRQPQPALSYRDVQTWRAGKSPVPHHCLLKMSDLVSPPGTSAAPLADPLQYASLEIPAADCLVRSQSQIGR